VIVSEALESYSQLPQMVKTSSPPGACPSLVKRGEQQRSQNRNQGNYAKQLK
jgi:hypothetical protein